MAQRKQNLGRSKFAERGHQWLQVGRVTAGPVLHLMLFWRSGCVLCSHLSKSATVPAPDCQTQGESCTIPVCIFYQQRCDSSPLSWTFLICLLKKKITACERISGIWVGNCFLALNKFLEFKNIFHHES